MSALKYWDSGTSTWKIVASATAGLPTGGTASQILSKIDGTDYNTQWTTPTGGGNVSNSGTPAAGDVAVWTDTTHIQGATGLVVSTSTGVTTYSSAQAVRTQLVVNNTHATSKSCAVVFQGSGVNQWLLFNDSASTGALNFSVRDIVTSGNPNRLFIDASGTRVPSDNYIGWSSGVTNVIASTADTALSRNAAGVVEINNGTAGTFRDLTLRNLTSSTTITYAALTGGSLTGGAAAWTLAYDPGVSRIQFILSNTNATSKSAQIVFKGGGLDQFYIFNDSANNGGLNWCVRDVITSGLPYKIYLDTSGVHLPSTDFLGWSSVAGGGSGCDCAIMRNGPGIVEINQGTAGTYRDLIARNVNATTAFQLNGTGIAAVYDFANVSNVTPGTSDFMLLASVITVTAGGFQARGAYRCVFDVAKTAGTGAIVITLRVGTAGTTADAAIQTFTFGAGTSVADTGTFEVRVNWRTVGSGTSAVISGWCRGMHNLATTGLFNNAAVWTVIGSPSPSSGFDSSAATKIGLSFNGSTAFAGGVITAIQTTLTQ